jgi:hypothetical protein
MVSFGDRRLPGVTLHLGSQVSYLEHPHARGAGYAEWVPSVRQFVCYICNESWTIGELTLQCPAKRCRGIMTFDESNERFVCSDSPRHIIG